MNGDIAIFITPFTLILGAGLLAAAALSFLSVHVFKTKSGATAALAGGLALIVLTDFIFATSGMSTRFLNGQRSGLLECRLDAERALPGERDEDDPVMQDHIVRCMNAFGYEWTTSNGRCKKEPSAANPFCYLPRRLFDRLVTQFQMQFG